MIKIVGLLGPNGAGKTTTFYMLVGLIKSDGGEIKIDDQVVTSLPMHIRSNLGISYLPQEASIFKNLTSIYLKKITILEDMLTPSLSLTELMQEPLLIQALLSLTNKITPYFYHYLKHLMFLIHYLAYF